MASFEWLAVLYFAAFAIAASARGGAWPRRVVVSLVSVLCAAAIAVLARTQAPVALAWVPHVYLIAGYWVPGLLARQPFVPTRFERWLVRTDARLRPALPGLPRAVAHATELAYLLCYPLVPASFAVIWFAGTQQDVERFWAAVLLAGYACYASLPWLVSRPPRLLTEQEAPAGQIGAVNAFVLGRVSHQLNTFPSGHVAVSLAAAGAVFPVSALTGVIVAVIATAVGIGAAAGRYHFVVDVLIGALVAVCAVAVSWLMA